jgi:transcriptional regulator with XRE-family HTH domain
MSDSPVSIETQLTNRVRSFLQATGISQRQLSKMLKIDPGNFNDFLSGAKTLSAEKTIKLLQLISLNKMQLEAKFKPAAVQLEHYQQGGQLMRLSNDGWLPKEGGSGDPNDSTDITENVESERRAVRR